LFCSFPDPHHPACPPGKYSKIYNPREIAISESFNENLENHVILGDWFKQSVRHPAFLRKVEKNELKKFLAYTYGSITLIDQCIGRILGALTSLDLEENTMVIFTSDHGDLMGDHGIILKGLAHYKGMVKVPMIWKVPELTKTGAVSDSLASSIDIPTTILKIIKIPTKLHPLGMQGFDLTPVLENPNTKIRDHCIIEDDNDFQIPSGSFYPPIRVRTMITEDYRITVYQGRKDAGDLYDLKQVPNEQHNLWNDKNSKDLKIDLLNKLLNETINAQSRFPKPQAHA
jgi:arylsulfatase A-like enzyme